MSHGCCNGRCGRVSGYLNCSWNNSALLCSSASITVSNALSSLIDSLLCTKCVYVSSTVDDVSTMLLPGRPVAIIE